MKFDEILNNRYSVRSFDDRPVDATNIEAMCEAARLAPSACNSQTWRFVVVSDRDVIHEICDTAMRSVINNKFLHDAPVLIVGCSQLDIVANRIGHYMTGIDYYQIDLGIAMEHMVLKATELELGTCWIGWFNEKKVKRVLNIPKLVKVSALLAVGYPAGKPLSKSSRKKLEEILYHDKWGEK